jgi:N-acetylmuramoyl-L-alanine amidase
MPSTHVQQLARPASQQARREAVLDSLPRVKRFVLTLALLVGALFGATSAAQERHNFLAVDDQLLENEVGPYYFIQQGNSSDAYARASLLAGALGASVTFDGAAKSLTFARGGRTVVLQTTENVPHGLQKRVGALQVNGQSRTSPLGILVGGHSYVAVDPIVSALGGESTWDASSRVLFIDSPGKLEAQAARELAERMGGTASPPRYAYHESYSRVAVNLPKDSGYTVMVEGSRLVVSLPGVQAAPYQQALDDPHLRAVAYAQLEGHLALSIETRYALSPDGRGFKVGLIPPDAGRPDEQVLYIDFAPGLQGERADALTREPTALPAEVPNAQPAAQPLAAAAPASRKIVVIDAGHGGHDPGASTSYATEKHVVLAITQKLKALLEAQGIEVILTRSDDTFLTLAERAAYARPEINLFVSVHANAAANTGASGIETWVFGKPLDDSLLALAIKENGGGAEGEARTQEALDIATSITGSLMREGQLHYSLSLADMVQREMIAATGAKDRGVRQNVFYVIRNARSPAILVEVGFVSNAEEGAKLATAAYQARLADALAKGILDFFNQGANLAQQ